MQTTGVLWDGTFLLIWSVTAATFEGSCNADIIVGEIYLILFFYDFLSFFLEVWPSCMFFKSHITIWPFIVPAIIMFGSLGLN